MRLSTDQQDALDGMLDFVGGSDRLRVARLSGAAGTGKTSVLAEVAKQSCAVVVTPTNRAAGVLRKKGVAASTIHSQIYETMAVSLEEKVRSLEAAIRQLEKQDKEEPLNDVDAGHLIDLQHSLIDVQEQLAQCPQDEYLSFSLRKDNALTKKVVIIDEASMVGLELLTDIEESDPIAVLLVGDENQLPPVKDKPVFQGYDPNWRLTKQHRTSEGSDILLVANAVIDDGVNDAWHVARGLDGVITQQDIDFVKQEMMEQAKSGALLNQEAVWITHTNKMRVSLNNALRRRMDLNDPLPLKGDVLISRKPIFCKSPEAAGGPLFAAEGHPQDRTLMKIANGTFSKVTEVLDHRCKVKDQWGRMVTLDIEGNSINTFLKDIDFEDESQRGITPWQYAYCLTAHRAQGSEWKKVTVVTSPSLRHLSDRERSQWLYTAVTRARQDLVWFVQGKRRRMA